MSRMIEVVIDSVRVSLTNQQRIVVLREVNSERYLAIWIGPYEAEAITIALQEIEVARPQTHDLLRNIINQLNGRVLRVEVVSLSDDVFYGNLVIEVNGQTLNVDSRPSDALALAVRAHVPILVSREVMDSAGFLPEQDIQTEGELPKGAEKETLDPGTQARLSVFEDFLQNLNISDEDDEEPGEDPGETGPKRKK